MRKKSTIVAIAALVLIAGALYGYKEYTRGVKDLLNVKADFKVEGKALISEFESNEVMANEKYLGKIISVAGNLRQIDSNDQGHLFLILGDEGTMSSIRCSMDSTHQADLGKLKKGEMITVKGACTGFNADELLGSDIILNRCVIDSK